MIILQIWEAIQLRIFISVTKHGRTHVKLVSNKAQTTTQTTIAYMFRQRNCSVIGLYLIEVFSAGKECTLMQYNKYKSNTRRITENITRIYCTFSFFFLTISLRSSTAQKNK